MNAGEHPLSSFFLLVVVAPVTEEVPVQGPHSEGFSGELLEEARDPALRAALSP